MLEVGLQRAGQGPAVCLDGQLPGIDQGSLRHLLPAHAEERLCDAKELLVLDRLLQGALRARAQVVNCLPFLAWSGWLKRIRGGEVRRDQRAAAQRQRGLAEAEGGGRVEQLDCMS